MLHVLTIALICALTSLPALAEPKPKHEPIKTPEIVDLGDELGRLECTTGFTDCDLTRCYFPDVRSPYPTWRIYRFRAQNQERYLTYLADESGVLHWSAYNASTDTTQRLDGPLEAAEVELLVQMIMRPIRMVACEDFGVSKYKMLAIDALGAGGHAKDSRVLAKMLKAQGNRNLPSPPACEPDCEKLAARNFPLKKIKDPVSGTEISVSVLTPFQMQMVFESLQARSDIPYDYPRDGCFARAQAMAELMAREGILSAKVFGQVGKDDPPITVETRFGTVEWGIHVAPMLWLDDDGDLELMVIDPSMFGAPIPLDTWKDALNTEGKLEYTYQSRYNMFISDTVNKKFWWDLWHDVAFTDLKYYSRLRAFERYSPQLKGPK